jgi:hypothetical protein
LAQGKDKWRILVHMVMKLWVLWKVRDFLTTLETTVHRSRVDPCGVYTSLVQCGGSREHAGGRNFLLVSDKKTANIGQFGFCRVSTHFRVLISFFKLSQSAGMYPWSYSVEHKCYRKYSRRQYISFYNTSRVTF